MNHNYCAKLLFALPAMLGLSMLFAGQVMAEPQTPPAGTAGTITVSGTITDENGLPLPGASVFEVGNSGNGIVTSLDGNYSIVAPADASLEFSFIGYLTQTEKISGRTTINISLLPDNEELEATVVVGYGTTKKVNLTGAISTVKSSDLQNRSALDVQRMLQGSVPGLNITTSSGRPGQSAAINVRGLTSINGGDPLVLIDGAEGNLERLNPMDVESISVIKDASSAAIYGARAAYGVVLVTTKSGGNKDGEATVTYSGRYGWTAPTVSTDFETRGYNSIYINNLFYKSYAGVNAAAYSDEDMIELWIRRNDKTEHPDRPWSGRRTRRI